MPANKKSASKSSKPSTVVMYRMDYEIAMLIYKRFSEIGMSDEEVSFLMGQRNKYVFDLLNPTKKTKFKDEHLDILPTILNCSIRILVPNQIGNDANITLRGIKIETAEKIIYEYAIVKDRTLIPQPPIVKHIRSGSRKKLNLEVHTITLKLLDEGYFDSPKNALELYVDFKSQVVGDIRPADLQKSLAICLRKQKSKEPTMLEEIVDARKFYRANGILFTEQEINNASVNT